jgi:trigger factor
LKAECTEEGLSKRRLDVEIPAETVSQAFEKEVARFGRSLKLPGFRKGKIPKDLVKTRFRTEVLDEVLRDLVPQGLQQALNQHALHPIGDPRIHDLKIELGKPLSFKASFEVMPKIEAKNYKGLSVGAPSAEVKDEDIENRLQSLRDQAARFDPVKDRGARDGDFVAGTLIEKAADGKGPARKQEGALIEVGADVYHPGLHEKLQGAKSGDSVSADVVFPDDHPDPKRAGKAFSVQMENIEVKEKVLPELDDELAKDLGQFENLAELRARLREQAEEERRREADQELRNQLLEKLIEANPFDPPEALVEHELDQRIEDMVRSLVDRGIDPSRAKIDWRELREGQRESAVRSVAATILLDRIVEQENLKETEEAIEKEIERGASAIKKSPQAVRAQLMKEGGLERLKRRLRRELAVDLLRESARIKRG